MSAIQIAGGSGAGKSAVAAELARRGLTSVDTDEDPLLARFVDLAGAVVAEEPAAPNLAWLARHSWAWDPARLDELIRVAAPATLFVCGGADNQHELDALLCRMLPVPLTSQADSPGPVPGAGNPRLAAVFTSAGAFGHSGPRPMIGLRLPWSGEPPTGRFAPRHCACRL